MLVSEFLTQLKRRGQIQAAQTVLSDADLVAIANHQLHGVIVPKLLSARQNYFQCQQYYVLSSSQRRYRSPMRAIGGRINRLVLVQGQKQTMNVPQIHAQDHRTQGQLGFYMGQGKIILVGQIPSGGMRAYYPIAPPQMSATAAAIGQVDTVSQIQFDYTGTAASSIEVVSYTSPYRTLVLADDTNTDNTAQDGLDPYASMLGRVDQLDIVIARNSTHIVPLQQQLCDWLVQRTYMRVLEYLGHGQQLQMAGAKLQDMQRDIMSVYSPRSQVEPKVISNRDLIGVY